MANATYTFSGSTQPVGLGNAGSLAEAVANINIVYHKELEDWVQKFSAMKNFYRLCYEGPGAGTDFYVSEAITSSGVAHETDENAEPWIGDITPGYSKSVTVKERTYSLALTWFFTYHNKYPQLELDAIRGAASATGNRMEYDMAMPFTYCTSTAVTNIDARSVDISTGDGLSLASASHTLRNSPLTYRNRIATDPQISKGAIELGENLFHQQMYDNNGSPVAIVPDCIVTASDKTTFNVAQQIVKSASTLDAPNASVHNPYQGAYRVIMASAIDRKFNVGDKNFQFDSTKQKQWMLVDSMNSGLYLFVTLYPTVMAPTEANGGTQFLTGQKTWKGRAVYEPVCLDPRFCVISVVTTS
ncbi:MAG: hypothetical protein WC776_04885 [Patescibacteria group bacterium]|jgi:hypothetical protein